MKKLISIFIIFYILLSAVSLLFTDAIKASLIDDLREEINKKEQEIKQLEQQAAEYKKELQEAQAQKNTFKNQLSLIESRIKKLQNDIYITTAKVSNASLRIEELSLDIEEKQNEIDKKKDGITAMIQALYEYDQESLMEIILMKNSFSEFLNQVHYIELLEENVHKDLLVLQDLKRKLEEEKSNIEYQRNQLYILTEQLSGQKQLAESEKKEKDYLLIKTKGEEKQYQSLLNEALKKQQEIQQEIFDLEEKLKRTIDPSAIPQARSGVLSWPVDGILTQSYGYTPHSQRLYKSGFHNGIDIASSYGEPIRAARDGKVVAIGDTDRYCRGGAYGKWIAIEHDNGLTTFYAHFSGYGKFGMGDNVKRGDIIGYEGNTGYSTGAHLHFGVYISSSFMLTESLYCGLLPVGAHLNPLEYL